MELRTFYQKIRQVEGNIAEPFVVVASLETPDGGASGTLTEVARPVAARLVVEGKARVATELETAAYYEQAEERRRAAAQAAAASKVQFTVISDTDLKNLRSGKVRGQ